jgi:hypothetical protein
LTAAVWAASDAVLDTSGNLLASSNTGSNFTLTLWTTLGIEVLALDTTVGAVMEGTKAFLTLVLDTVTPVLTALSKLAASKVVDAAAEFTATEAVALVAGSFYIAAWLQAEGTVLCITAAPVIARLVLWLTATDTTGLTLGLAKITSWTLQLISTNDITVVPVAFTADFTRILEADVAFTVFAALTEGETLEAWLLLSLTTQVVAVTTVVLREVTINPLT